MSPTLIVLLNPNCKLRSIVTNTTVNVNPKHYLSYHVNGFWVLYIYSVAIAYCNSVQNSIIHDNVSSQVADKICLANDGTLIHPSIRPSVRDNTICSLGHKKVSSGKLSYLYIHKK
jgi:hypothetical protein